jgi:hypothetical protein
VSIVWCSRSGVPAPHRITNCRVASGAAAMSGGTHGILGKCGVVVPGGGSSAHAPGSPCLCIFRVVTLPHPPPPAPRTSLLWSLAWATLRYLSCLLRTQVFLQCGRGGPICHREKESLVLPVLVRTPVGGGLLALRLGHLQGPLSSLWPGRGDSLEPLGGSLAGLCSTEV